MNKMEDKELDKLFQDTFTEAEEAPSQEVWTKIEASLPDTKEIVPLYSQRRWWLYASAAVVTIGLTYFGITYQIKENEKPYTDKEVISAATDVNEDILNKDRDEKNPTTVELNTTELAISTSSRQIASKAVETTAVTEKIKPIYIENLSTADITLAQVNIDESLTAAPKIIQVVEIEEIKPLIEPDEETEYMLAEAPQQITENNKNIITTLLNTISENIDSKSAKEIRFYADEEGSFGINIINSIAKNKKKKIK